MSEPTAIADKKSKTPKKNGRPSKYTPEIAAEICKRLSDGEPLRQICRSDHMPHWSAIYEWMARDEELSRRIAYAREQGADAIAEEALEILDTPPERVLTKGGDAVDSGYVTWQRNRAELRLKLLAKWHPKKYGDRQIIMGDKDNPLEVKADVSIFDTVLQTVELGRQAKKA